LKRDHDEIRQLVSVTKTSSATTARIADLHGRIASAEQTLKQASHNADEVRQKRIDEQDIAAAFADFDNIWNALNTREPNESTIANKGRIPRVRRLVALAIKLDAMLRSGEASDATELAELSHISQPRMSQILSLTLLAPDIQEDLLYLPRVTVGRCPVHEKMLRRLTA